MRARKMCACITLVIFGWLGCSSALAGSKDLADSVKAVLEANEPESWPARCQAYRAEMRDSEPRSAPQRVESLLVDSELPQFQVVDWNGVQIPIPDVQFDKVVVIPGSLAAVRSESTSVLFSNLDLTPHFQDHFGGIDEFSGHVASGRNIVEWLEDGLALNANDIQCQPESMAADLVRIVHFLVANVTVLVDDETRLMRLNGTNSALLFEDNMPRGESTRVQYIFQRPRSQNIELVTVTYHFEQSSELVPLISAFASAIENAEHQTASDIGDVASAILDQDYEAASSVAKAIGLTVQTGLE